MIGEVLKKSEKKNLTQKELASKVNVDQTTVSGWERGYREPNFEDIASILKLCNYDIVFKSRETKEEVKLNLTEK